MRIALVVFLVAFSFSGLAQTQPVTRTWDTIPRMVEHYQKRRAQFAKEKTTTGKIMFLGNSITEGGDWRKLLNDSTVINRGIGGDITFGIRHRLDEVARFQPAKLFLLIGINDLSKGIPEEVVLENIFLLLLELKKKSPGTAIYVQSILPVNPSFKNFPKGYDLQEQVNTINTQLSKIQVRFGYTYVNLYNQFTDAQGLLRADLSSDGLHLNAAGYVHWVKILREEKHL